MYTTLFAIQAAMQFALFLWLLHIWRTTRTPGAAVLLFPQFGLVWDNLIVALGGTIGLGPLLYWLSWPRFWIHWLMGAWLIIATGCILRLAGFEWAKRRWFMVSLCLLTVAMMLYDVPYFFTQELHPVCEFDLVRYSTAVREGLQCFEDQPAVAGSGAPLPQLVAMAVVLAGGLALWIRRGFPWLFLGGLLMLISAMPPFMRFKLDNFGEVCIAFGAIYALWHFTRKRVA